MIPQTLNTNEIKNAAGTEVEFQSQGIKDRKHAFTAVTAAPAYPHLISVNHAETGSGIRRVRRSVTRVDLTFVSDVDNVTPVTASAHVVLTLPVGAMVSDAKGKQVLAELGSAVYLTGADNTLRFDGTGTFGAAMLTGGN